jgi:hypothetical protein
LEEIQCIHDTFGSAVLVEYVHAPTPQENDRIFRRLAPHSVVINATGVGKDIPGSPLTDAAIFPEHGIALGFQLSKRFELFEAGPMPTTAAAASD